MTAHEKARVRAQPEHDESIFRFGVFVVIELHGKVVVEDRLCFFERDLMLLEI
jgi:hypothetical protein